MEETDLQIAKRIATIAVRSYGEGGIAEQQQILNEGIWNDHPAVQAVLILLKEQENETN